MSIADLLTIAMYTAKERWRSDFEYWMDSGHAPLCDHRATIGESIQLLDQIIQNLARYRGYLASRFASEGSVNTPHVAGRDYALVEKRRWAREFAPGLQVNRKNHKKAITAQNRLVERIRRALGYKEKARQDIHW